MFVGNVDPDDYCMGNSANPNETKKTSRDIIRYFPALSTINVIRAWGGPLDLTPDDMPILGDVPGIEGLVIGCGFSGHGFASSPFVGKMLGEHIGRGRSPLSLYPFRLSRFTELHEETGEEMYAYGQAIGKNRS
jgi:glycine/D-amino acid oxidase-like deaminating enzyme